MAGDAPVGVSDAPVVAVGVAGGVGSGLVPSGVGLRASGVGLRASGVGVRASGVGATEAVAVDVGVGAPVAGCSAIGIPAPTMVSSAPAAQMIWPRRRKPATNRRRSATMEGDYRPAAMALG